MKKLLLFLFLSTLFSLSVVAQGLTYNVTVPSGTNACYIAGDMTGWSHMPMDKLNDTHYTITIAGSNAGQGYKYCSGPNWAYEERWADGSWRANRSYTASDVVEKWLAVYVPTAPKIDIKIMAKTPWTTTNLHIWGDASTSWPGVVMNQMNNSVVWEYTIPQVSTVNIIFNNGSGTQTADINNVTANGCYEVFADGSYAIADCNSLMIISSTETPVKPAVIVNGLESQLTVELTGKANATVYTLQGALVSSAKFENSYTFGNLKAGMYILNVNGKTFKALVK